MARPGPKLRARLGPDLETLSNTVFGITEILEPERIDGIREAIQIKSIILGGHVLNISDEPRVSLDSFFSQCSDSLPGAPPGMSGEF